MRLPWTGELVELKQILDSLGYSLGYIAIRTLEKYSDTQQMILV